LALSGGTFFERHLRIDKASVLDLLTGESSTGSRISGAQPVRISITVAKPMNDRWL